jgi:uncharacterized protein (UPF0261 family)
MLLNPDETKRAAETIAEKVNKSVGPVEVIIPTGGLCSLTGKGTPFYELEKASGAERVLIETLKNSLRSDIPVKEIDSHINEKACIDAVGEAFLRLAK